MLYVRDAIKRMDIFIQEVKNSMPAISTEVTGLFITAKIEQIRKKGIGQYSKKKYSASFLKGKELNSAGRSFVDSKIRAKQKTNWSEFKQAQGLQGSYVDAYYSGQTLNSTGIERANSSAFIYYSVVGARNDEARKKLYALYVRYGRFLDPTAKQRSDIGKLAISKIGTIYKRVLLT